MNNRKQDFRTKLLTFLYVEGLEPTNNLAEREIRPGVVARKISAGNRGDRGANAHAVLGSLIRTCQRVPSGRGAELPGGSGGTAAQSGAVRHLFGYAQADRAAGQA